MATKSWGIPEPLTLSIVKPYPGRCPMCDGTLGMVLLEVDGRTWGVCAQCMMTALPAADRQVSVRLRARELH